MAVLLEGVWPKIHVWMRQDAGCDSRSVDFSECSSVLVANGLGRCVLSVDVLNVTVPLGLNVGFAWDKRIFPGR